MRERCPIACVVGDALVHLCVFTPCAGHTSPPATSPGLQVYTPATSPPVPQPQTTHCSTNACASDSIRQVARAHSAPIVAVLEGGCVLRVSSEANATLASACACLHSRIHVCAAVTASKAALPAASASARTPLCAPCSPRAACRPGRSKRCESSCCSCGSAGVSPSVQPQLLAEFLAARKTHMMSDADVAGGGGRRKRRRGAA